MVALKTAYAPSKTLERSQNRVGDFFCEGTDRLGKNRLPTRNRTKENRITVTIIVSGRSSWLSRDPIAENGGINLYAYVLNDPVNYWDPLGLNALILNDSSAVGGQGHNASLVGNDQAGWLYTSRNGESLDGTENFDMSVHDTKNDFLNSSESQRYDRITEVPTTSKQDEAMQQEALDSVVEEYSPLNFGPRGGRNCSEHVDRVSRAGNLNMGRGRLRPNTQFNASLALPGARQIR